MYLDQSEGRRIYRYYASTRKGSAKRLRIKGVRVDAFQTEEMTKIALQAFLVDRPSVSSAVLSLGRYTPEVESLLLRGPEASRRIARMDRSELRHLFEALLPRIEVTRSELKLIVGCAELCRFLAWDGIGIFKRGAAVPEAHAEKIYLIKVPTNLLRERQYAPVPISPRSSDAVAPDEVLVRLLERAAKWRALVLANRGLDLGGLAKSAGVGKSYFARVLRLNYLAPDIQTAIIDGTQPPNLTKRKLEYSSIPLDWEQQRQLLGFTQCQQVQSSR